MKEKKRQERVTKATAEVNSWGDRVSVSLEVTLSNGCTELWWLFPNGREISATRRGLFGPSGRKRANIREVTLSSGTIPKAWLRRARLEAFKCAEEFLEKTKKILVGPWGEKPKKEEGHHD